MRQPVEPTLQGLPLDPLWARLGAKGPGTGLEGPKKGFLEGDYPSVMAGSRSWSGRRELLAYYPPQKWSLPRALPMTHALARVCSCSGVGGLPKATKMAKKEYEKTKM